MNTAECSSFLKHMVGRLKYYWMKFSSRTEFIREMCPSHLQWSWWRNRGSVQWANIVFVISLIPPSLPPITVPFLGPVATISSSARPLLQTLSTRSSLSTLNKFQVSLTLGRTITPSCHPPLLVQQTRPNYRVLATDYQNYAIVYDCVNYLGLFKAESLWLLTRAQFPDQEIVDDAYK